MTPRQPTLDQLQKLKLQKQIDLLDLTIAAREDEMQRAAATNLSNHVLSFAAQVDPMSVGHAMEKLSAWHRYDPATPVVITISSPGGYVFEGLGLYDLIRELVADGAQIETRVTGYAASMAGVLLQGGSVRSMSPHSYLMIHEVGSDAWGKTSAIRDELELAENLEEKCLGILASRSTLSAKQIRARCRRKDWWLDSEQALKLGLVDAVR